MTRSDLTLIRELRAEHAAMLAEIAQRDVEEQGRLNLIPRGQAPARIIAFPFTPPIPRSYSRVGIEELMPFEEIAKRLGISTQAAHQSYHAGMRKLRKYRARQMYGLAELSATRQAEVGQVVYPAW